MDFNTLANDVIAVVRRNLSEHYFDMKGRAGRKEFWYFVLGAVALYLAAAILGGILRTHALSTLLSLALLLPLTGLGARRLQDANHDGKLVWIWLIAAGITQIVALAAVLTLFFSPFGAMLFFASIAGILSLATLAISLVLIYFWVQPGTVGPNAYGPDPLTPAP